jgi:hypothetical protein
MTAPRNSQRSGQHIDIGACEGGHVGPQIEGASHQGESRIAVQVDGLEAGPFLRDVLGRLT